MTPGGVDPQVAGARWQGTRMRLESDDEEPDQVPDPAAIAPQQRQQQSGDMAGDSEDRSEDTHVSSRGGEGMETSTPQAASSRRAKKAKTGGGGVEAGAAVGRKLLKLACSVLRGAGGRLRLKKLEKRVLDAAGVVRGSAERKEARRALACAMHGRKPGVAVQGCDAVLVA